ncbi:MAG: ABC transporter permease [Lachnospiraceae bacterium]|jgi:peptide/nickel transport system permease protein|nr:ABC transporter permease [Lachnospiraceae bacterium]NBJ80417.1 ABC transporter permease [bacterium 1XD42-76]NBK03626.1 ABC transporter permease [bacterium 1XD42-94]
MIKYIGKRILMLIPVLLGVVLLVFSMMYFSPGSAEDYILGDMATEEDKEAFREENGLNAPFIVQYFNYVKDAVRGDLGISYTTKQPVADEIFERFPTTFKLALLSTLWSIVIGITIGIISAVRQYSILDHVTRLVAMLGVSVPTFWEGLMLIILFSVQFALLPSSGFTTWKHWILPSFTIGTHSAATVMRMMRSSMLEAIRQDYITTAKAKGQTNFIVVTKHALRNAIIPVMTLVGVNFGRLLGGSAITEIVFSIPGLGNLIIAGIKVKNAPLVQGGILVIALAMALCNLIVDVLYAYVDPRIRSQYVKPRVKLAAAKSATTEEK